MCRRQRIFVAPLRLHLNGRCLGSFLFENFLQRLTNVHVHEPVKNEAPADVAIDVEEEEWNENPIEQLISFNYSGNE